MVRRTTKVINALLLLCYMFFSFINCVSVRNPQALKNTSKSNSLAKTCNSYFLSLNDKQFNDDECDMITDGAICLNGGKRVILPLAVPKGLVGYWDFDEVKPLDNSGNKNHAINTLNPGVAFGGIGSSSLFSGNFLQVPAKKEFESNNYSITFWIFLIQDFYSANKGAQFCPLIQRGKDDLKTKTYQRSPALFFDRKDRYFRIYTSTGEKKAAEGEYFKSNARVSPQRWMHVALVKVENVLKLYINGIIDAQAMLKSPALHQKVPLYIGNTPAFSKQCQFPYLMDELRYYNIALTEEHIQAEASPALGGVEPNFVKLGCMDCSLKLGSQSCIDGYHLCTSIEMHTAGYQAARAMGWLNWNTHIWTHGALKEEKKFEKLTGLALCCADLK